MESLRGCELKIVVSSLKRPHMTTHHLPAAGIDIGYFSVKYTLGRQDKRLLCGSFPALAPRANVHTATADSTLGATDVIKVPVGTSAYYVGPDAALMRSSRAPRLVLDDYSTRPEYQALLTGALYQIARHHLAERRGNELTITNLVVGLPLSTMQEFKKHVQQMCLGTHTLPSLPKQDPPLLVHVENCTVIAQPHGTIMSTSARAGASKSDAQPVNQIVLDMGGGTFDWFTVRDDRVVLDLCGAHARGMLAAANAVADAIKPGLREDPFMIERIDHAIRERSPTVSVMGTARPLEPHQPLVDALINECLDRMIDSVVSMGSMDQVIVTGGGARRVAEVLEKRMPELKDMITVDEDPVFSNVRGFHLVAEMLNTRRAKVAA